MMIEAKGAMTKMAITAMDRMISPFCTPRATTSGPSVACTVALPGVEMPMNSFSPLLRFDLVRFKAMNTPIIRTTTPIRIMTNKQAKCRGANENAKDHHTQQGGQPEPFNQPAGGVADNQN